jgi:N-acetylglutamate synthase-like GNAT family acetyltransferase
MTVIRKATDRDIPGILELYEQLTEEKLDLSPDIAKRVFAEITALPRQEFLVAEKDGRVAGTFRSYRTFLIMPVPGRS